MAATTTGLVAGSQALGAGTDVVGAFFQSQALGALGRAEKMQADFAASQEREAAQDALRRGEKAEGVNRRRVAEILGAQRAGFAAGNVDVSVGSAVDVAEITKIVGEDEVLSAKITALRQSFGFRGNALNLRTQGKLAQIARRSQQAQTIATAGMRISERAFKVGGALSEDQFLLESSKKTAASREQAARTAAARTAEQSRGTSFRFKGPARL